jgi:hypothetical protein
MSFRINIDKKSDQSEILFRKFLSQLTYNLHPLSSLSIYLNIWKKLRRFKENALHVTANYRLLHGIIFLFSVLPLRLLGNQSELISAQKI